MYGDQYRFWKKSSDGSSIIYTQQYKDKPLFENEKARLEFNVNGENEIYSYTQSYLEDIQELSNPEKIIQPIKAIEILYKKGELPSNSKITDPELGYYIYYPSFRYDPSIKPSLVFYCRG